MLPLYEKIEDLCKKEGTNITQMCKEAGIPRSALSDYKAGRKLSITLPNIQKIADYFNISIDELLGNEKKTTLQNEDGLNEKEKKDIAKRLEQMLGDMSGGKDALMFDGEPMDEETMELLRSSIENTLRMSKILAKEKFTPKKYRKKD